VAGFAEALEAEVAKDGVSVLTVMPGLMRTGSHIHARFHGAAERELHWFGTSAIAPLISIDADRAARKIVTALARGDRFLTYTPAARLGAWLHDTSPNAWALLSCIVGHFLPNAPREAAPGVHEGIEILRRTSSRSALSRFIARRTAPLSLRHNQ
jgi:NAD(P)-dependent dehydrogenase (short-subunit alcohol dehydrogenase family)